MIDFSEGTFSAYCLDHYLKQPQMNVPDVLFQMHERVPDMISDTEEFDNTETMEDLGRSGFCLIQKKNGFRYGEDTVLLSFFAAQNAPRKRRILKAAELGTNCGAASILLAARRQDIAVDGMEVQCEAAGVFEKNISLNHLEGRLRSFCCDIRDLFSGGPEEIKRASYDLVFFNPPYHAQGRGPVTAKEADSSDLLEARFEVNGTLEDFFRAADWLLLPQGKIILVQRTSRLPEVLRHMADNQLQPSRIRFVHVRPEKPATLFLLCGQKHGKAGGFQVLPPLILYKNEHSYSDELHSIYFDKGD